jgi:N-carbamoyl-L-amino-acid hydrolase
MAYRTVILFSIFLLPVMAAAQSSDMRANPDRMEQHIKALSAFGANPEGGASRVAFSDADLAGRAYIMDLMRASRQTRRQGHPCPTCRRYS